MFLVACYYTYGVKQIYLCSTAKAAHKLVFGEYRHKQGISQFLHYRFLGAFWGKITEDELVNMFLGVSSDY